MNSPMYQMTLSQMLLNPDSKGITYSIAIHKAITKLFKLNKSKNQFFTEIVRLNLFPSIGSLM